jgi:hypothetical protein
MFQQDESKLSPTARAEFQKLQAAMSDLVQRDKTREPKLTADEHREVKELEARIAKYTPRVPVLMESHRKIEARLTELSQTAVQIVADGGDLDVITDELVHLQAAKTLAWDAVRLAQTEVGTSRVQVNQIKKLAREREAWEANHEPKTAE